MEICWCNNISKKQSKDTPSHAMFYWMNIYYLLLFPQKPCLLNLNWWHLPNELFTRKQSKYTKQFVEIHLTIKKNDFVFTSEIHSRLLRSSSNFQLYTPRPNTELFRNSLIFSDTLIWNSIPEYIRTVFLWNISNHYIWDGTLYES